MVEIWQGRVFASNPDEAALLVRQACGCENGKLTIRDIWPGVWYEYYVEFERVVKDGS